MRIKLSEMGIKRGIESPSPRRSTDSTISTDAEPQTVMTEDETELYDRQIRLWGFDSQKRLRAADVLIIGMNGLGAEIAKNIVLAGVKSITILDDKTVTTSDYDAQFLIGRAEVGKNRSEASRLNLQQLNSNVTVISDPGSAPEKSDSFFASFDVVCAIDCALPLLVRLDELCWKQNFKLVCTDTWGTYGFCFTDFALYSFGKPRKKSFRSADGEPSAKIPRDLSEVIHYHSLQEALKSGKAGMTLSKRIPKVFFLTHVLLNFREVHGRYPKSEHKEEDIVALKAARKAVMTDLGYDEAKINDETFDNVFGEFSAVCAILGGAVGQEIIRAICGDKTILKNFFFFNGEDCSGIVEDIG